MTSRNSVAKKLKKKNLPKIEAEVYSKLPANNLVVYVIYFLEEKKITPTIEDIVSTCFRLFPHSFALKNYPRWPDSALVIRRINDVRAKGIVKGDAAEGYAVKYNGKLLAIRTAKALGLVKSELKKVSKKKASAKTKTRVTPTRGKVNKNRVTKTTKLASTKKAKPSSTSSVPSAKKGSITRAIKPKATKKKQTSNPSKLPAISSTTKDGLQKTTKPGVTKKVRSTKQSTISSDKRNKQTSETGAVKKAAKKIANLTRKVVKKATEVIAPKKTKKHKTTTIKKTEKKKTKEISVKNRKPAQLQLTLEPAKEKKARPKTGQKEKTKPRVKPKQPGKPPRRKVKEEKKVSVKQRPVKKEVVAKPPKVKKKPSPKSNIPKKQIVPDTEAQKSVSTTSLQFTKEEKAKAVKVIRMVEKSSAYKIYKKYGGKSRIGEFDFRDMLLSTMESSAETLKRNVELFKRYAAIENRSDLVSFLVYCEGNFKTLLTSQKKKNR